MIDFLLHPDKYFLLAWKSFVFWSAQNVIASYIVYRIAKYIYRFIKKRYPWLADVIDKIRSKLPWPKRNS